MKHFSITSINYWQESKFLLIVAIALCAYAIQSIIILAGESGPHAQEAKSHGIVAVVNDDIISKYDLDSRIKFIIFSSQLPKDKNMSKKIAAQVLHSLITERLKLQETKNLGIKVSENELRKEIRMIEKKSRVPTGKMQDFLRSKGLNYRTFEIQIKANIAWRKAVIKNVRSNIKISDRTIDETINSIEEHKGKPEYFVAEIFTPFNRSKSLELAYQSSLRLHSQLKRGASFPALARSFSYSASATKDGKLGWIRIDQIDKQLSSAVKLMEKGSFSRPIKSADGFYILYLLDKRISGGIKESNTRVVLQQVLLPLNTKYTPQEIRIQLNSAKRISSSVNNCLELEKKGIYVL